MPDAHRKLQCTVINGKSDTPSLWAVPAHHPRRRKGYRVALGTSLSQGDIRRNLAEMALMMSAPDKEKPKGGGPITSMIERLKVFGGASSGED
jgi:hypothetical protein